MENYKYQYVDPLTKGFTKIKVSKENHNKIFKYKKRTILKDIKTKVEYYESDKEILIQFLPTVFTKVLLLLIAPFIILFYGIGNPDVYSDIKRIIFPKKYGSFTSDIIFDIKQRNIIKGLNDPITNN